MIFKKRYNRIISEISDSRALLKADILLNANLTEKKMEAFFTKVNFDIRDSRDLIIETLNEKMGGACERLGELAVKLDETRVGIETFHSAFQTFQTEAVNALQKISAVLDIFKEKLSIMKIDHAMANDNVLKKVDDVRGIAVDGFSFSDSNLENVQMMVSDLLDRADEIGKKEWLQDAMDRIGDILNKEEITIADMGGE